MTDVDGEHVELPFHGTDALGAFGRTLLLVVDTQGRIEQASSNAMAMVGRGPDELVGTQLPDVIPAPALWDAINRAVVSCERQRVLHDLAGPGGVRACEALVTPFRSSTGIRVHVATTDLSHHLRQIEALETAQGLFHAVLESASDAIFGVDENLRVVTVSRRVGEVFGNGAEEVLGMDLRQLFDPPVALEGLATALREGNSLPARFRAQGRRSDGQSFAAEVAASRAALDRTTLATLVVRDITERERMEAELQRAAQTDVLTGLLNRSAFMDALHRVVARATSERPAALLFVDLDGFKPVNDRLGHAAGDEVLRQVAGRIRHGVRTTDVVGRLGGDEFVVLLSEISAPADAQRVAATVVDRVARPYRLSQDQVRVTCSVGVALCPADSQDAESLLALADGAMYRAKQTGRNRSVRAQVDETARPS